MTDRSWLEGWDRLRLCFPEQVRSREDMAIQSNTYRRQLDCLTDEQWSHAVAEALKHERFFPTISVLLEYGDTAPARIVDWTGDCPLCEGSGFEPFQRGGYAYVQFCPRGCKPRAKSEPGRPDYRTREQRDADARVGLKAIEDAMRAKGIEVRPVKAIPELPLGEKESA